MKQIAYFSTEPESIHFESFGDNIPNKVWMRKDIEVETVEQDNEESLSQWKATEVYFETFETKETIEADFDGWFDFAALWDNTSSVSTFEIMKSAKIAEYSATCNSIIKDGIDVKLSDGKTYHFSLQTEDQINLNTLQAIVSGLMSPVQNYSTMNGVPYHADGQPCRYFSVEDFSLITATAVQWALYQQSYFNSLKKYIESLSNPSVLAQTKYGMDIPELYKTDVLKDLEAQMMQK